jgi:signal transduction histidine kinase
MATQEHFRISSHLKDIIGRDLVTNEFVAVFELVKNSFDAGAARVDLAFDNDRREIWIVDDGKGMDAAGIRDRWLFVAYSAKADGSEGADAQSDYRDRIRPNRQFAGSKGIGRFSCDTLGGKLTLYSRTSTERHTQQLVVEWERFEADSKDLFQQVGVSLGEVDEFPPDAPVQMPKNSGTVLRISDLRGSWEEADLQRLRQYLEKLIDPFGTTENTPVHITVVDSSLGSEELAELQGPVGNDLQDLLSEKTTHISVAIEGSKIRTKLVDRGRTIYRVSEPNNYLGLEGSVVTADIFFLNRSAKANFTRRMGVRAVEFGSIFLFLNGFRIFPIGEETDDTLGLNRRKQQGSSRYLGTRDLLGRVDVKAPPRMFREASSRDAGLIEDARTRDLFDAIRRKAIFRLERYVVGVSWQDKGDADREDASGFAQAATRSRIAQLIGQLATTGEIDLEYYDPEIVELFDDDSRALDAAMRSLAAIAEDQGDINLLKRVESARSRQSALEQSEREATEAARRAMAEVARADERIALLERQATYLASTQDMTAEQMTLLLHQVLIYAGHIGAAVDRALGNSKQVLAAAKEFDLATDNDEMLDAAASVRVRTQRIVDDLDYIHLENDRLMAVARFASNARFDLETDMLDGDVVEFLDEYVNQVRASRDGFGSIRFEANELAQVARFRPVDLVVVVDNLMDNARKHGARQLLMSARHGKGSKDVEISVTDDGRGMDEPRIDAERVFDKGYTSTEGGTGLGLYHARKVLESMGGGIRLDPARDVGRADFIIELPRGKKS